MRVDLRSAGGDRTLPCSDGGLAGGVIDPVDIETYDVSELLLLDE